MSTLWMCQPCGLQWIPPVSGPAVPPWCSYRRLCTCSMSPLFSYPDSAGWSVDCGDYRLQVRLDQR